MHLLEANSQYAHVRFPDGKETPVSLRHLAPVGEKSLADPTDDPEVPSLPTQWQSSTDPEADTVSNENAEGREPHIEEVSEADQPTPWLLVGKPSWLLVPMIILVLELPVIISEVDSNNY